MSALAVTLARRAVFAVALIAGVLAITAAVLSHSQSQEHEHTMKCLAAYMAFIQVVGGPEEESIERLKSCERAPHGEEPIHLGAREHPFVVTQYEACLAAHLLMTSDLDKSLAEQKQHCH
jgi:hypothetical protein